MPDKLTAAQRHAEPCPDCGDDPDEPRSHRVTCRRLGMQMTVKDGGKATPEVAALELQCGPPWNDWPEGTKPVNPLAKA